MKYTFMPLQIMHEIENGNIEFTKMFNQAKAAGFSAYDASENDLRFATHREVCRLCEDAGLEIADYIHWMHVTTPDNVKFRESVDSAKEAVHTALEHGTNRLMIVENIFHEDLAAMSRADATSKLVDAFSEIVEYAAEYGVTVMFEDFPSPALPLCTSDECGELLRRATGLKLVFDTANMLVLDEDPVDFYTELRQYVAHVHLKDVVYATSPDPSLTGGRKKMISRTLHGQGIVDFPTLFRLLRADNYDGFATVEYSPSENGIDHFKLLAQSIHYFDNLQNGRCS